MGYFISYCSIATKGVLFHTQELNRIHFQTCKSRVQKDAHNEPSQRVPHYTEIFDICTKLMLFCDNAYYYLCYFTYILLLSTFLFLLTCSQFQVL